MVQVNDDSAMAVDEAVLTTVPPAGTATVLVAVKDDALPAGVSQVDFDAALAAGREKGHLTPDELIDALHNVELTPEVLATLLARINAEGVALVDDDVDDLAAEIEQRVQIARRGQNDRGQLERRPPAQGEREAPDAAQNPRAARRTRSTPTSRRSVGSRCSTRRSRWRSRKPSKSATRRPPASPRTSWPSAEKGRPTTC